MRGQFSRFFFLLETSIGAGGPGVAGRHCAAVRETSLNDDAGAQGQQSTKGETSTLEDITDAMTGITSSQLVLLTAGLPVTCGKKYLIMLKKKKGNEKLSSGKTLAHSSKSTITLVAKIFPFALALHPAL